METSVVWILLGKLPILVILGALGFTCSQRLGHILATWSLSAFFVSISIGISILPSILGAFGMATLTLLTTIYILSNQKYAWHSMVWPLAVSLLSIIVIGRVGCWLSGCCFGELTQLPWATTYSGDSFISAYHLERYGQQAAYDPLPVHPVQLYESITSFFLLILFSKKKQTMGEVSAASLLIGSYLLLYALLNPLRAYLNTPSSLNMLGPISQLQMVLLIVTFILLLISKITYKSTTYNSFGHDERQPLFKGLAFRDALIWWLCITACGALSLNLGTALSAQISVVGVSLSAIAFVQTLKSQLNQMSEQKPFENKLNSYDFSTQLNHNIFVWAFFVAIAPLILLPLTMPINASSNMKEHLPVHTRAWKYRLDAKSHKALLVDKINEGNTLLTSASSKSEISQPLSSDSSSLQTKQSNHQHQPSVFHTKSCVGDSYYYLHKK